MIRCSQPACTPAGNDRVEGATIGVLVITLVTMVAEIVAGWRTGSMALLADGWHMGMHAVAMGVAVYAYRFARRNSGTQRYSFGAGKAVDLGGFTNAVMLAVIAVLIGIESVERLVAPVTVAYGVALLIAALGLAVNLLSAWLLRNTAHDHDAAHPHQHHDHNREAAFIHVLSDALTSALAIAALLGGKYLGLTRLDPIVGVFGAVMILRWAAALVRRSGEVLLDAAPEDGLVEQIAAIIQQHGDELHDLHVWPVAAGRFAVAIGARPVGRGDYRQEILALPHVAHLTLDRSDPATESLPGHRDHHRHAQ